MLRPHTRATTLTFHDFKRRLACGTLRSMDYFVKYDGFHLVAVNDFAAGGGVSYFTKWGTSLETGVRAPSSASSSSSWPALAVAPGEDPLLPAMGGGRGSRLLRAINAYLHGLPDEDRVVPARIERPDAGCGRGSTPAAAQQVNFEFCCARKRGKTMGREADHEDEIEEGKAECLQDLFQGKCLNPDGRTLNVEDYEYRIRIFDCAFKRRMPLYARVEAAACCYGEDMAARQLFSREELVRCLNGHEGVVAKEGRTGDGTGRWGAKEEGEGRLFKIKVPCPVRAKIVGVRNTLGGEFIGWDKLLVCIEKRTEGGANGDDAHPASTRIPGRRCFVAICEIDLTDIFTDHTRPSRGKVFAHPKCVKRGNPNGEGATIVYELADSSKQSSSAIAPMLNAVFGLVGRAARFPPVSHPHSPYTAEIRTVGGISTVSCGRNRSFKLSDGYEYLTEPIDIIMGVNDIWPIASDEFHLQAPTVLCVPAAGYGPGEFALMPPTDERTLREAAERRLCRDRVEYYRLVGMPTGPFDDLPPVMRAELFMCFDLRP